MRLFVHAVHAVHAVPVFVSLLALFPSHPARVCGIEKVAWHSCRVSARFRAPTCWRYAQFGLLVLSDSCSSYGYFYERQGAYSCNRREPLVRFPWQAIIRAVVTPSLSWASTFALQKLVPERSVVGAVFQWRRTLAGLRPRLA